MPVEGRVESLELKTYIPGPEDPYAPFQRKGYWSIYPYSLMDDLGEEVRPVRYRALVVENEYLRVTVLPELGGHLYSAVDKATGEEIFYRNHVVKPGLIGLRGAWISGGIEFNFPRGHTVTTISPVDGLVVQEEDGSAVVWVGDVEQRYRMAWAVGIRLRPGSSAIETEVRLTNPTSLPHPYYFWANAAVPAREDMRLVYPATRARTWQGPVSWPVHEGRDLTRQTSYRFSSDSFMLDSLEDFFGVYYEERDFGVGHVANVHECFGKKFFTWGTAAGGKTWASILSDEDGPYCEMQSGRFVDQGTWRLMPPHHAERWTEYWYPVKGIGGFAWANREAAVRVCERDGRVECGVMVTRPLPGARVVISAGDREVHEREADLSPDRPLQMELPKGPGWSQGPYALVLLDAAGREVIRYRENQPPRTTRPRASRSAAHREAQTAAELLRKALAIEQAGDIEQARVTYSEAVKADRACVEAAVAGGRLSIESKPEEAISQLTEAAEAAPESGAAVYYLGVALRRRGRGEEAAVELWRASQHPEFAHAAQVELGAIAMGRQDWQAAAETLARALDRRPDDAKARCLRAAALRRGGRPKEAMVEVEAARESAPFDRLPAAEAHFCCAELGRPRVAARRLRELQEMTPLQADPWLELAFEYSGAGLTEEAVALLRWAIKRVAAVRKSPLVHYSLAYWLAAKGEEGEATEHRRRAEELSPHLVFPHHWELEAILRDAVARGGEGPGAHYCLGMLLYGQGRRTEGLAEWEAAAARGSDSPLLHRSLGFAYREVQGDLEKAAAALQRAVGCRPLHPRPYIELDEALQAGRVSPDERLAWLDHAPSQVARRGVLAAQQVAACLAGGHWDRAISLLASHTFHSWEADYRMRVLHVEAHLGRGAERFDRGDATGARQDFGTALEYPERLRIGKPAQTEDARAQWCAGQACEALGDAAAAKEHWEAAAAETYRRHIHTKALDLHIYRALSLRKLGRTEEAEGLLEEELRKAQEAAESAPGDARAHMTLGLALKAMGRSDEAEGPLRRALELDPWLPRARRLLEREIIL